MSAPASQSSAANVLHTTGTVDEGNSITELHLADGSVLRVATAALLRANAVTDAPSLAASTTDQQVVIPVIEEQLEVSRRVVETGTVRLQKTVQEFKAIVDEPLALRTYDVERVMLNQPVEAVPETRVEGDTTIYPVMEEQLILTKQLILKEEVRVTRRETERRDQHTVVLRREQLLVEREPSARYPNR